MAMRNFLSPFKNERVHFMKPRLASCLAALVIAGAGCGLLRGPDDMKIVNNSDVDIVITSPIPRYEDWSLNVPAGAITSAASAGRDDCPPRPAVARDTAGNEIARLDRAFCNGMEWIFNPDGSIEFNE
ncbi:hypothetical protein [Euzebya tangerina]|uniref:hypothetical protein n=1 Tax=Euzebya tangerina TaxID=591198 RepID=UPI0013C2D01B|nr:hypothetical protein [Euzebya tangerina]